MSNSNKLLINSYPGVETRKVLKKIKKSRLKAEKSDGLKGAYNCHYVNLPLGKYANNQGKYRYMINIFKVFDIFTLLSESLKVLFLSINNLSLKIKSVILRDLGALSFQDLCTLSPPVRNPQHFF